MNDIVCKKSDNGIVERREKCSLLAYHPFLAFFSPFDFTHTPTPWFPPNTDALQRLTKWEFSLAQFSSTNVTEKEKVSKYFLGTHCARDIACVLTERQFLRLFRIKSSLTTNYMRH